MIFFSPFIFQSLGGKFNGETGSLVATVIVGAVQVGTLPVPQPFRLWRSCMLQTLARARRSWGPSSEFYLWTRLAGGRC